jgi:hypothetical protein
MPVTNEKWGSKTMKDLDDFNKLEERAWQLEKMLEEKYGINEIDSDELQYDKGKIIYKYGKFIERTKEEDIKELK